MSNGYDSICIMDGGDFDSGYSWQWCRIVLVDLAAVGGWALLLCERALFRALFWACSGLA